jgi:predicted branched-subunit amino acid permease
VEAMRFLTARRWWPGRSSYAATSVLADEAYAVAALRIPRGNRGSGTARSSVGVVAVSLVGASRCEATRAARCRSIRAW